MIADRLRGQPLARANNWGDSSYAALPPWESADTSTTFQLQPRAGLSLAQVAERLGSTSPNSYARYEQGRSVATVQRLSELFAAVMPQRDLVLVESEA